MYSKTITWVSKDKWIGLKKEFYDNDGKLLKTLTVKDYKKIDEKMQNSNAIYKGSVIDYLYHPMFFDSSDINRFIELTAMMHTIVRKTVKEYLNNSSFRKKFNFSKEMEKLIKIDPGYSNPVPIARFDLFYSYDDKYKFCELNGDGSSAMNEANTVEEIVYKSEIINNLKNNYNIKYYELFYSWVDEIINIYRQFGNKEKPNVAIVDFEGLGTPYEFVEFKRAFQSCGYKTQIIDPRELSYKQNALYHGDFRIDLVYRRAVNREIVERINEVKDFIEAYRNRDVCVVGPFRSQIMHNKKFFSIISNESNTKYLNKDEKKFIRKHVPQTGILKDNDNLIEKIKGKKPNMVHTNAVYSRGMADVSFKAKETIAEI